MASTVLATGLLRHFLAEPIWTRRLERPGELLRDGLPIAAAHLLSLMVLQGPLWVVGALGGATEAALYGASVRVAQSLGAAQMVSNLIGAPHMVTLEARGEIRRLSRMSQALSLVGLAPPLIMLGALLLLGRKFMALVFGPAFVAAPRRSIILTAGRTLQMACGNGRIAADHDRSPAPAAADRCIDCDRGGARRDGWLRAPGHRRRGRRRVAGDGRAAPARPPRLARRRLGFWPLSLPEVRNLLKHSLFPRMRPSGPSSTVHNGVIRM